MSAIKPCSVCVAGGFPECCTGHTETVIRLAEAIDRSLMGPPGHLEPHPEWYIEDAEALVEICADRGVDEGSGWVLEHDPGFIGEFFKVNGVEMYLDVNAEGFNTPVLGAERRAEMAEEAAWE